jgi:hypothetical protein
MYGIVSHQTYVYSLYLRKLRSQVQMWLISTGGRYNRTTYCVSDPYLFFPDPDPEVEAGDQYGSGSGSNTDPGL